jgi:hypothetical protein
MEQTLSCEANSRSFSQIFQALFVNYEVLLSCLHESATGPCPESGESNPYLDFFLEDPFECWMWGSDGGDNKYFSILVCDAV